MRRRASALRASALAFSQSISMCPPDRIDDVFAKTGSLIRTIEALRSAGRSLVPYQVPNLHDVEKWLADNEVLDPDGPSEMLENLTQGKLLRSLRQRLARFR